jgi:hypothetical protein
MHRLRMVCTRGIFFHGARHELFTTLRLALTCLQHTLLVSHTWLFCVALLSLESSNNNITTATLCFYNGTSLGPCYPLRDKFGKPRSDHIKSGLADEEEPVLESPAALYINCKFAAADNKGILLCCSSRNTTSHCGS